MEDLSSYFFHMLYLAKTIHDNPRMKKEWLSFGSIALDEDSYYELSMELSVSIFKDTSVYYNEESGVETWVLSDPIVYRFCELCERLESEKGLDEGINPYRRNAERMLHESFCLSAYNYDYDWRLSAADRRRKCILFFSADEFYGWHELPGAFMEALDGFQELNRQLEAELGLNKLVPIYPMPNEWKEAVSCRTDLT